MSSSPVPAPAAWRALATQRGFYNIVLGNVLGGTIWHSFFGGPIAYKNLGRRPFSQLQEVIFPKLFAFQTGTSLALAGLYSRTVKVDWARFWRSGDRNVWALALMTLSGLANWVVVGPMTTKVMKRRHRRERIEDKEYNDPKASPEMQLLNRRFALLHSAASLLNLVFISAAATHAAYVAAFPPA
ncbi:hypothetical protein JCM10450v2_001338 [Rhodotorula kratochvilovae]